MSEPASGAIELSADQRAKEHSVASAITMDVAMTAAYFAVAVVGGSFTLLADSIRGALGLFLECFNFVVMRRIHRGVLVDLDYGTGKLEQIANLVIGASMLLGAAWIAVGVLRILSGDRGLGTPIGLAFAAMTGGINVFVNLVALDGVRRAAALGDSLIMNAQLVIRRTKLIASVVVLIDLTVAARSTDDVVVAWADALGAAFVAVYTATTAFTVLRAAVPDLLDRSAGIEVRHAVERGLAQHRDAYAELHRVRSRRAGHTAFVEITLGFDSDLSMAEVDRRIAALTTTMRQEVDNADISIVASTVRADRSALG